MVQPIKGQGPGFPGGEDSIQILAKNLKDDIHGFVKNTQEFTQSKNADNPDQLKQYATAIIALHRSSQNAATIKE